MQTAIKAAVDSLGHIGQPIECDAGDWPEMRRALQDAAGRWIDTGQGIRAILALEEVKRLDAKFGNTAPRD